MSQLEKRPTSQQGTASNWLTWVINFFFEEWGVVTILRNNSWSLNFHHLPWHGSSWYWEFFGSTDTLKKTGAFAKPVVVVVGSVKTTVSFLYCLLLITALSILPIPPQTSRLHVWNEVQKEKNGCYQCFKMTRLRKKMAFLYFPPKFIF